VHAQIEPLITLDELLRLAAASGASTLYVSPNAQPTVRIDGEVLVLEDQLPMPGERELEGMLFSLKLAYQADVRPFPGAEWTFELPDVGRIRCMTFSDQHGAGGVFRIPLRTAPAEEVALSIETQALATEKEGLVLISGERSSGKHAIVGSLVDLVNRTRQVYVVAVQREVNVPWEGDRAFISQREARGGLDDMLAVARAALRENPDVLVLQEVRSAPLMTLALDAAASGQLVIAGYTARSATAAIEAILNMYPFEQRRTVQLALAQHLRGVVVQALVPRSSGGRIPARELLLNTPPVATALAEGKIWQLPLAIEAGNNGMVSMQAALLELIHQGEVTAEEAYRQAPDPIAFLEFLNRQGMDTSFWNPRFR
jgi:twitching motility protein PilT